MEEKRQPVSQYRPEKEELSLLCEVAQLFSSSLEPERVMREVSRRSVEALGVDLCLLRLIENDHLVVRSSYFRHPDEKKIVESLLAENPIRVGECIAGRVALTGEPTVTDGVPVESLTLPDYADFLRRRKWLLVPLKIRGHVIGVLTFITADPARYFSQRAVYLAQGIANQAAIAIENARLFDKVERSERLYRTILESSADAIVSLDNDLKIRAWSTGAERIFGYTKEELIGQPLDILVPERERSTVAERRDKVRDKGFIRGWETQRRAKDGRLVDVEITLNYLGPEMGLTGILRDITERKQAEEALRQYREHLEELVERRTAKLAKANEQLKREIAERKRAQEQLKLYADKLEESNQELQHFINIISHDFQEPLAMVASYMDLMRRRYTGKLDSDADKWINYVANESNRAQRLSKELLRYSRLRSPGKKLEPTDCEAVFDRVLVSLNLIIADVGAQVTSTPLPTIMADGLQMEQLFQNLIRNALKFRGKEPPRVHVSAERNETKWIFSVQDNGIGMDAEFAEHIFHVFRRVPQSADHPGVGIGLAICKKIVQNHGGRIWVESKPEKGSTFYFTIPASD